MVPLQPLKMSDTPSVAVDDILLSEAKRTQRYTTQRYTVCHCVRSHQVDKVEGNETDEVEGKNGISWFEPRIDRHGSHAIQDPA